MSTLRSVLLTTLAMTAFAGNSLLCRLALTQTTIDAASFTTIRLASGIGYAIWYTALPALRVTTAATVQLSVPVIAASGGIALLGEPLTMRLLLASAAVLGGIALVILVKQHAVS